MARSHARIYASIWDDKDFCALPRVARHMYFYLLSQPDLEHSGIIGLRVNRWADTCEDETPETIREGLAELEQARFVAVDWQKEELLVRSLIRRDEVWRQPNVFKAAAGSIRSTRSPILRAVLLAELERLDCTAASRDVAALCATLVQELRASLPNHSPDPSGNPSRDPGEPPAMGTPEATGEGKGNGEVPQGSTFHVPRSTSPRRTGRAERDPALVPFAVPDLRTGEGDQSQDEQPPSDLDALVAEVRALRDDWSAASIRKSLLDQRTQDRPWPLVRAAALIRAADLESRTPAGLPSDGWWWEKARSQIGPQAVTRPRERTLTCPEHQVPYSAGGECRSCAADRKAATA